jgi:nitrate reductase cytochrome c-type subunit
MTMQKKYFALHTLLCMCLLAPAVQAQEFSPPDREHRQGMSYEEYANFREKMRLRMEKNHADQRKAEQEEAAPPAREHSPSNYGQGYQARQHAAERPEPRSERPERGHFERPQRGEMMRR